MNGSKERLSSRRVARVPKERKNAIDWTIQREKKHRFTLIKRVS